MKSIVIMICAGVLLLVAGACEGFLDERPNKNIVIPSTLDDMQALLDASNWGMNQSPGFNLLSGDELVATPNAFLVYSLDEQEAYKWGESFFENEFSDWSVPYSQAFYANVILDGITDIDPSAEEERIRKDEIIGSALFLRANGFYNLLSQFAPAYQPGVNDGGLGIPLRMDPNINIRVDRSDLKTCYDQVIGDLNTALPLLRDMNVYKSRPSKAAVHALLARIYLAIEDYEKALNHANSALGIHDALMDYNQINASLRFPVPAFNEEVIYHTQMVSYLFSALVTTVVNPEIYNSYATEDLRRSVFFLNNAFGSVFKGTYSGTNNMFSGLATNELYLVKAECEARAGNTSVALAVLNQLLEKRWVAGSFEPFTASGEAVLDLILAERKKELLYRGVRWSDLRRLNRDPRYAQTLTRVVQGESYSLPPNSNRYTLPIPLNEVNVSGITQNNRN
ncbi:SusD family protein [Belliella buryatensis]|uniref:SusD family protein n=1 Tax=Belliella buryatensis TaxID=1500549 RepID=A0A239GZ48_9BACT|nr:RagB/SusD family nutrient uptake outer membrane protein [Belliella buryatensis]SNS74135.1 SusD family protein [Belliella buryatensis]